MSKHSKEQISKNMRAVKSKGSKIELLLGKSIWNKGIRYRKNNKTIFGKPDFSIKRLKLAIFVDGDFWHGKDWQNRKNDHKSNKKFWLDKIERNISRDREVNIYLKTQGWIVLRFWGSQINRNVDSCAERVYRKYLKLVKLKNMKY